MDREDRLKNLEEKVDKLLQVVRYLRNKDIVNDLKSKCRYYDIEILINYYRSVYENLDLSDITHIYNGGYCALRSDQPVLCESCKTIFEKLKIDEL